MWDMEERNQGWLWGFCPEQLEKQSDGKLAERGADVAVEEGPGKVREAMGSSVWNTSGFHIQVETWSSTSRNTRLEFKGRSGLEGKSGSSVIQKTWEPQHWIKVTKGRGEKRSDPRTKSCSNFILKGWEHEEDPAKEIMSQVQPRWWGSRE